jgi:hypothetical protein
MAEFWFSYSLSWQMLARKEAAITIQVWVNTQELQCCIGQQGCGLLLNNLIC